MRRTNCEIQTETTNPTVHYTKIRVTSAYFVFEGQTFKNDPTWERGNVEFNRTKIPPGCCPWSCEEDSGLFNETRLDSSDRFASLGTPTVAGPPAPSGLSTVCHHTYRRPSRGRLLERCDFLLLPPITLDALFNRILPT